MLNLITDMSSHGDGPSGIEYRECNQASAEQLAAFDRFQLKIDEELFGGRQRHPCHLVWKEDQEAGRGKRARWAGSVGIFCVVCGTTHALGEGSQMFGNFYRSHLSKPKHLRAAGILDDEELPDAAAPEALAGTGTGFVPDESEDEDEGERRMVPELDTALIDLLAHGLHVRGGALECRLCRRVLGRTTDGRVVHWARTHVSTADHLLKAQAATGQQSLAQFGFTSGEPEIELCWGFHERTVKYGSIEYDVALIIARDHSNTDFATERNTTGQYQRTRSGPPYLVQGCIRASGCLRTALESFGIGPRILSCAHCRDLPEVNSFRMLARQPQYRVRAPDAPPIVPSARVNFDNVSKEHLVQIARRIAANAKNQSFQLVQLSRKLVASQARVRSLAERLGELSARGEIKQLFDNILRCERAGKFEERKVLFDFISDMVRSLVLTDTATGRRSRNMRWSETTLKVFASIKIVGGPRLICFFGATLEAPSAATIARMLARTKLHVPLGPDAKFFEQVGELYRELKRLLGITGLVAFEMSEDETTVQTRAELCARLNAILGLCGEKCIGHCCEESFFVFVGGREVAYGQITQALKTMMRATSMRLVVINPIHPKLPKIVIFAHGTCNRFDAAFIAKSWRLIRELAAKYLAESLGPLVGHASDGDARRFHNQLFEMSALPPAGSCIYALDAEGFTLHGMWDGQDARTIRFIHSQDPRHNLAKLYSHCAVPSRVLQYGIYVASHALLVSVLHDARERGEPVEGVTESNLSRKDRQVRGSRLRRGGVSRICARAYPEHPSAPSPPSPRVPASCRRTRRGPPTAARSELVASWSGGSRARSAAGPTAR